MKKIGMTCSTLENTLKGSTKGFQEDLHKNSLAFLTIFSLCVIMFHLFMMLTEKEQ